MPGSIKTLSSDQSVGSRQHSLKSTALGAESSWPSRLGKGGPSELRIGPRNSPSCRNGATGSHNL